MNYLLWTSVVVLLVVAYLVMVWERHEGFLKYSWKYFLAWTRLDLKAVCELSFDYNHSPDFHNVDDASREVANGYVCGRCGKVFFISR